MRGYCVETKRYYELVYLVRYRYRGTGTSQLSAAAQRFVKAREPVARVSSERRSVSLSTAPASRSGQPYEMT